jgi:heat shock protein HslJ
MGSGLFAVARCAGVAAIVLLSAGGCVSDTGGQADGGSGQDQRMQGAAALQGSRWQAEDIEGHGVSSQVPSTLAFDATGRASGSGGCNRFFGPAQIGDGSIRFGSLVSTRMACPPPRMEQEDRFFAALAKAERWHIGADGRLVLADGAGNRVVVLSLLPPADAG